MSLDMYFIIKEPGAYRCRDGRKAIILGENPHQKLRWIGFSEGNSHPCGWHDNGMMQEDRHTRNDLMCQWSDDHYNPAQVLFESKGLPTIVRTLYWRGDKAVDITNDKVSV